MKSNVKKNVKKYLVLCLMIGLFFLSGCRDTDKKSSTNDQKKVYDISGLSVEDIISEVYRYATINFSGEKAEDVISRMSFPVDPVGGAAFSRGNTTKVFSFDSGVIDDRCDRINSVQYEEFYLNADGKFLKPPKRMELSFLINNNDKADDLWKKLGLHFRSNYKYGGQIKYYRLHRDYNVEYKMHEFTIYVDFK